MDGNIETSSVQGLLILKNLPGVGDVSAVKFCRSYKYLEEIMASDPAEVKKIAPTFRTEILKEKENWQTAHKKALRIIEKAEELDVRILTFLDADYPQLLLQIHDFPPIIYVKGNLPRSNRNVACVGTREPTAFGQEVAKRLVKFLVANNWTIVSGLAVGVDSIGHETAVENGGITIAVLANGLDQVYPKQNQSLAQKILGSGGALLSEQPFGTEPMPALLVQRDRIQSGISIATVAMQTGIKGGTMQTVRYTLLQGRSLFVPTPPETYKDEPKSQGNIALINQSGVELSKTVNADSTFRTLLMKKYGTKPVARPIRNRNDYNDLIDELENLVLNVQKIEKLENLRQANLFEE